MEKKVSFNAFHEFIMVTDWLKEGSLDIVEKEVSPIRDNYFKFVKEIDSRILGMHTRYEEIDADEGVEKWFVEFTPKSEPGFTQEIKR